MIRSTRLIAPCLLAGAIPLNAIAADPVSHEPMKEVVVTGTPLDTNPLKSSQPISVIAGEDLHRQVATSLGETVSNQPGVTST